MNGAAEACHCKRYEFIHVRELGCINPLVVTDGHGNVYHDQAAALEEFKRRCLSHYSPPLDGEREWDSWRIALLRDRVNLRQRIEDSETEFLSWLCEYFYGHEWEGEMPDPDVGIGGYKYCVKCGVMGELDDESYWDGDDV